MKLGFFTMPLHPLEKDWRQSLREDREAFILADELGYVRPGPNFGNCIISHGWLPRARTS